MEAGANDISEQSEGRSAHEWLRIAATVVLALATIATAWGGYQAARWNSATGSSYSQENTLFQASNRAEMRADTDLQIDVAVFLEWIDATAEKNDRLATFYEDRFREEFKPAFEEWIASRPLENPDAANTPFRLESYSLANAVEAERLRAASAEAGRTARSNSQIADNYVFVTVLFATTLFFAGVASNVASRRRAAVMLAFGVIVFGSTVAWVSTFPIDIGL